MFKTSILFINGKKHKSVILNYHGGYSHSRCSADSKNKKMCSEVIREVLPLEGLFFRILEPQNTLKMATKYVECAWQLSSSVSQAARPASPRQETPLERRPESRPYKAAAPECPNSLSGAKAFALRTDGYLTCIDCQKYIS